MERHWDIRVADGSETSRFAAEEFARLIARMDPSCTAEVAVAPFAPAPRALWIGVAEGLGDVPHVPDRELDDAIHVDVRNGAGFVTGSNPRSVLIGVYRFFREAGCAFVRPGRAGEFVPERDTLTLEITLRERAAYRCRGICLEGSVSYANVVETIDFAPKLGFNAYYTQLFRPAFAFRRWYGHQNNPALLPTPVSNATIDAFVADFDAETSRRGLFHHRIGHGWVSRVLGITSGAWHEANSEGEVRPDRRELIAELDGERRLFAGSGIDTNLCYSDPRAVEALADEVVAYARQNPQTRYLHFWLADHANNQCMCPKCKDKRPADQYVEILNRIDEKLAAEKLPTKIVFLIYLDMLWAPVKSRLKRPERFVMTYAPIRRSYSMPTAADDGRSAAPFARNGFALPVEPGGSLPYLKAWQQVFDGDSFVFDYHYMWDYFNDPGSVECARIMEQDVSDLGKLGLNGMMSCQNQRVFLPSGLGMNLLGDALWSGKADFNARAAAFFAAAFGGEGGKALAFLEKLSRDFDPPVLRGEKPIRAAGNAARYAALAGYIDGFLPAVREYMQNCSSPVHRRSWECLEFHALLCRQLAQLLAAFASGDDRKADGLWAETRDFARANETRFQREFDLFEFLLVWENKILPRLRSKAEGNVE